MTKVATRQEALQKLSTILRKRDTLSDDTFLKVMTCYARLQGWIK